ncbi:MAG: patatin, partial [Gemmatimonadetes bacterium]|nr:patatin [Gemmatimonadota bacterium]NIY45364.1 patatin [Gemmatimonadota bacterium]
MLFNTIFLDTLEGDAERLQRINRVLEALPPGTPNPDGLRPIKLLVIRPSRDLGTLAE